MTFLGPRGSISLCTSQIPRFSAITSDTPSLLPSPSTVLPLSPAESAASSSNTTRLPASTLRLYGGATSPQFIHKLISAVLAYGQPTYDEMNITTSISQMRRRSSSTSSILPERRVSSLSGDNEEEIRKRTLQSMTETANSFKIRLANFLAGTSIFEFWAEAWELFKKIE